jgi:hypothetical protein
MIGLLSQIFRGALAGFRRLAEMGRGPAGTCSCGMPLHPVDKHPRGWCQRCGFAPEKPESGWRLFCPSCKFMLGPPVDGWQSCPHCHWQGEYPRGGGRPRGRPRRNSTSGCSP